MKPYVIILIILCFPSCRSNRNVDRTMQEESKVETVESTHSKDSSHVVREFEGSNTKITNEQRYIRTTQFNPDGSIRCLREEWRGIGSIELADGRGRSSEVSVSEQKTDSTYKRELKKVGFEKLKSFTDTRPVQGSEWLWILLAVGIIGLGIFLIKKFVIK